MTAADKFLAMARAALSGGLASAAPPRPSPVPLSARLDDQVLPVPVIHDQALPAPVILASYSDALAVLGDRRLSGGAARLWKYLHALALHVSRERRYTQAPRQITYHCPAVTLAGLLGVTDRHLRRLAGELEGLGLLDAGGHAQQIAARSLYDGTLWAVLMTPGGEPPRIRADEWKHAWRPDFVLDLEGKTGAAAEMSELQTQEAEEAEKYEAAKRRAAISDVKNPPPLSSSDILPRPTLRAVLEGLPQLLHLHSSKRARAVGVLASQIAAALVEPDRRRYWCRVIWEALRAENEQRQGLQVLGAQLARLDADLREGAPWKNPGAVLAARLKAA